MSEFVPIQIGKGREKEVVAKINADASAGPLLGKVMGLLAKGYSPIQGDFNRAKV